MKNAIPGLVNIYKLQTRLFINVVQDFSDTESQTRLSSTSTHVAWITGHIVSVRYQLARVLGLPMLEPFPQLFEGGKRMNSNIEYPPMHELTKHWPEISDTLIPKLAALTESDIQAETPIRVPIQDDTLGGFIAFLAHHEGYHIGQIGIARRYFGLNPMSYGL